MSNRIKDFDKLRVISLLKITEVHLPNSEF